MKPDNRINNATNPKKLSTSPEWVSEALPKTEYISLFVKYRIQSNISFKSKFFNCLSDYSLGFVYI